MIFEIRRNSEGEYHHLVTAWSHHKGERIAMPKRLKKAPAADEIADRADRAEDISSYFTNKFIVVRPVHRVNIDLTQGMLRDLDARAAQLNISRQAVIKTLLGRALSETREERP
jgi:hypothetical protein